MSKKDKDIKSYDDFVVQLQDEIEMLEKKMLDLRPGSRAYNNLKNEQWGKINKLKCYRQSRNI